MNTYARFGFKQTPFTRELSIKDCLKFPFIETEVDAIIDTIQNKTSATLIAPAGTGKSVALRTIKERLPEARYAVHYVKVTGISKRDMCREICIATGATTARYYADLIRSVQNTLLRSFDTAGLRPVLIIDEAHDMLPSVLAMLRVLTNFEMDSRLVISIVLAGQLPLKKLLQTTELDDIAKRISHRSEFRLLSRDETTTYIEHRVHIAGAIVSPFDNGAVEVLFELSRGNMRAIDELARKSLDLANSQNHSVVDQAHVIAAKDKLWI